MYLLYIHPVFFASPILNMLVALRRFASPVPHKSFIYYNYTNRKEK